MVGPGGSVGGRTAAANGGPQLPTGAPAYVVQLWHRVPLEPDQLLPLCDFLQRWAGWACRVSVPPLIWSLAHVLCVPVFVGPVRSSICGSCACCSVPIWGHAATAWVLQEEAHHTEQAGVVVQCCAGGKSRGCMTGPRCSDDLLGLRHEPAGGGGGRRGLETRDNAARAHAGVYLPGANRDPKTGAGWCDTRTHQHALFSTPTLFSR